MRKLSNLRNAHRVPIKLLIPRSIQVKNVHDFYSVHRNSVKRCIRVHCAGEFCPRPPEKPGSGPSRFTFVRAVMALTPRETLSKAKPSAIFPSQRHSLACPSSGCAPWLYKSPRYTRHRGDDFQRNSRLTRRRPIAHQSASVCRPADARIQRWWKQTSVPHGLSAISSGCLPEKMAPDRSGLSRSLLEFGTMQRFGFFEDFS